MNNFKIFLIICWLILSYVMVGAQTRELEMMAAEDAYKVRMNSAKEQFDKKNYDGAIIELNKVLQTSPNNYQALFFRALSYFHQKKYDQAVSDLGKVTADSNSDRKLRGSGYALRAVIYRKRAKKPGLLPTE